MLHKPILHLLAVFALAAAVQQHSAAVQYPAGVNPHDCPGYPVCDNARLHGGQSQWNAPKPTWQHATMQHWQQPTAWQHQQSWSQHGGDNGAWHGPQVWEQHDMSGGNNGAWHEQQSWSQHGGDDGSWHEQQHGGDDGSWHEQQHGGNDGSWHEQQHGGDDGSWHEQQSWSQHGGDNGAWKQGGSDKSGGDKYPAGVNPHACPNYPFCDVNAGQAHAGAPMKAAAPLPGWSERMYPAGVSPHQCPNFPYCH